jgi:predicted dinucleotide-binding enzyme
MNIGIIGAGMIGGTLGELWHAAGHSVCFGTRNPQALEPLVASLAMRARAGSPTDAASFGEVLLLAVPLLAIPELGRGVGAATVGKVVIDAGNAYVQRDGQLATRATETTDGSSAWVASYFPGARVVKAFNTVHFKLLREKAHAGDAAPGIPIAGDDSDAREQVARLVRDSGFEPVVVGGLAEGKRFEPGTSVYNTGMNATQLAAALVRQPP